MGIHNNDYSYLDNFSSVDNFLEFLSADNNLLKLAGTALAGTLAFGAFCCLKRKKIVPIKTIEEVKPSDKKIAVNLIVGHASTFPFAMNAQKFLKTFFPNSEIKLKLSQSVNAEDVNKMAPGIVLKYYGNESKEKRRDNQLDIHFPGNGDKNYSIKLKQELTSWIVYGYSTSSEVLKKSRNVESMILGIPQKGGLAAQHKVGLVFNEELFQSMGKRNSSLVAYKGSKALIDSFMKKKSDFSNVDLFFGEYSNVPAALKYILLACKKSASPEKDIVIVLQGDQIYDHWFGLKQLDQLQAGLVYHLEELSKMGIHEVQIQVSNETKDLRNPYFETFLIKRNENSQLELKNTKEAEKGKQKGKVPDIEHQVKGDEEEDDDVDLGADFEEKDNGEKIEVDAEGEDHEILHEKEGKDKKEEAVKNTKENKKLKSLELREGITKKLLIVLPGTIPYKDTVNLLQLSDPFTTVVSDAMISDAISAGKVFSYVQPRVQTEFCKKLSDVWNRVHNNEALDDLLTSDSRYDLEGYLERNQNKYSESDLAQGFMEFSKELHENQNFMLFLYNKLQEYIALKA